MGMRESAALLMLVLATWPSPALAGSDPDRGMSRALGVEEPWIETAVYLTSSRDNVTTSGHTWNANVEWDVAFSRRWGAEIDGPGILAADPLGQGATALAPLTFGLKYAPLQWGDDDSEHAGIISMELEGSWWPHARPDAFPGIGSNVSEQVLVGLRQGSHWFQGEYGVSQRLAADARSGWFANSDIGQSLGGIWNVQMEVDANHTSVADSGATTIGIALTPQVGVRIDQNWQLLVGETYARTPGQSGFTATTNVLIEYGFDQDEDEAAGS
jgi:hypothetical protein